MRSAINAVQKQVGTERIHKMIRCNSCANFIPEDSEFCPFCGNKITRVVEPQGAVDTPVVSYQPESLLKRAFIFIEDGLFDKADAYLEAVLNQEPENAEAYLGKLLIDMRLKSIEDLSKSDKPFDNNGNYVKALRYGDNSTKEKLTKMHKKCIENIAEREKQKQEQQKLASLNELYSAALSKMTSAHTEEDYNHAALMFTRVGGFRDADKKKNYCYEQAKIKKNTRFYLSACEYMEKKNSISNQEDAISLFEQIPDWKDSQERINLCKKRIDELKLIQEETAKKAKKIAIIVTVAICVVVAFIVVLTTIIIPNNKYNSAIDLMNEGNFSDAISIFESLEDFRDSNEKISDCYTAILDALYANAISLINEGKFEEAISEFEKLNGYKDSADKISDCNTKILDVQYNIAVSLMNEGKYREAISAFEQLNGHKDSVEQITECNLKILDQRYEFAISLMNKEQYNSAISTFESLNGHRDSKSKIEECESKIIDAKYELALTLMNEEKYSEALDLFKTLGDYKNSASHVDSCNGLIKDQKYNSAILLMDEKKYKEAISIFESISFHRDSKEKIAECEKNLFIDEYGQEAYDRWGIVEVGDTILFGEYKQDHWLNYDSKPLEWIVLDMKDGKIFLTTKYAISCEPFFTSFFGNLTWQDSSIRTWLNKSFFTTAFSEAEKQLIATVIHSETYNYVITTTPEDFITDKIFLLSVSEVKKYFSNSQDMICTPTQYAQGLGDCDNPCSWWLRNTRGNGDTFRISKTGEIALVYGQPLLSREFCVRPAMWLDLTPQ